MLFSSPLQLLVLCTVALGSWLLGFATNPNAINRDKAMRKLDRDFTSFRAQSQSRLNTLTRHAATLEATHQTMAERLSDAEARIARFQLEASERAAAEPPPAGNAMLEDVVPMLAGAPHPASDSAGTTTEPLVPPLTAGESAAPPPDAEPIPNLVDGDPASVGSPDPAEPPAGWIGGGVRDALTRIDGIDAALALRLFELGMARFEDIEKLSDQDEMALELRLALPAGYITGRQWRQQAATLRTGDLENHVPRSDAPPSGA